MRFIPVSLFDEGEFEQFATSDVAVGTAQSGPLFGSTQFPEVGEVDIYPIETSLQKVVFQAAGTEDTFGRDAYPYSQPFFTRVLQPVENASTYNFIANSGGADRIINYVGTNFVSQSINMGTAAHDLKISCLRTPTPYYSGLTTGTSITESFEVGYDGFQDFAPSNRSYVIKFTARPSVIATGSIAYINYVDTNGNLQNYELIGSGSTVELECQTALHLDRGDAILGGVNLRQEILRPSTARTLTPYPYHGTPRKYRIETKFDAGTLSGQVTYMSGSNRYTQGVAYKGTINDVIATEIPMVRQCAMVTITDISNWNELSLVSQSVSESICTNTTTGQYFQGDTGSLLLGEFIYSNIELTNKVGAGFWRDITETRWVQTDSTGEITRAVTCDSTGLCETYRFEGQSGGGSIATFTRCGESTATSQSLGPSENIDVCLVSGSYKSITGTGATITFLGEC